jgi:hypothetical protein
LDEELYQLCVNYNLRALLGDNKGQMILNDLEEEDPDTYNLITAEASRVYNNLAAEQKLNTIPTLISLMEENIRLQFEITKKRLEQKISYVIWRATKPAS